MMNLIRGRGTIARLAIAAAVVLACGAAVLADVTSIKRVSALDINIWTVWAAEGRGSVEVIGDGETDLDCYVFDRFGTLLGKDEREGDRCTIRFRHRSNGDITIFVRNRGIVYNDYFIRVK